MKAAVALCLLFALCTFEPSNATTSLVVLRAEIAKLKVVTTKLIGEMKILHHQLYSTVNLKLGNIRIKANTEISTIINPVLRNIEQAATKAGNNALPCYERAKRSLNELKEESSYQLDYCTQNALSSLEPLEANIADAIGVGNKALTYLNSIFPSCFSISIFETEKCVREKMPVAEESVANLRKAVAAAKDTEAVNTEVIIEEARTCSQKPVGRVAQSVGKVREKAFDCIQKAEKNQN
ncbi:uncharacterized protein LOC105704325 [Orussus abietinus]|uniref:uncharacterized protein LOC105704325 n=1 Tax=Orussus abietinus TaxID=222816 RepID=UPI0006262BAE|nr:uncharacterized protein LOC105704325 [Orussus abietinus]